MELGSHINNHRIRRLIHAGEAVLLLFVALIVVYAGVEQDARASALGQRTVVIADNGVSQNTSHGFQFDILTAHAMGSIEFEYCTNSPLSGTPCTVPAGINVSGAVIGAQVGEVGFSVHPPTTANRLVLGRAPAITTPGSKEFQFNNMINPSVPNQTIYVRISTFATNDGTGPYTDNGGVAFAVSPIFSVNAYVPPFLILCVGVTVQSDCSSSNGTNIDLGVLASSVTAAASSQFGIATNDPLGYQAYTVGTTMTSGNNVIPPLITQAPSQIGTSQFGINVRANTIPSVGQNPSGLGGGTLSNFYDDVNLYRFQSGDLVATSPLSTDFNVFTISYIVNVNAAQPPGRYSTTMTIVGIAAF